MELPPPSRINRNEVQQENYTYTKEKCLLTFYTYIKIANILNYTHTKKGDAITTIIKNEKLKIQGQWW